MRAALVGAASIVVLSCDSSVAPPAASRVQFLNQPVATVAGQALESISVALVDEQGNTVTGSTANVSIALDAADTATLQGTTTAAAVNGVATFTGLRIDQAGPHRFIAFSGSLQRAQGTPFNITHAEPTMLVFTSAPTRVAAGVPFSATIQLRDAFGNRATSLQPQASIALDAHPSGATMQGVTARTMGMGEALFTDLKIEKAATGYSLSASVDGFSATSAALEIFPTGPDSVVILTQPTNVRAGQVITPAIRVALVDQYGNVLTDYQGSAGIITETVGVTPHFYGTINRMAVNGIATFDDIRSNTAASQVRLKVSMSTPFFFTDRFDISAGPPAKVAFVTTPGTHEVGDLATPAAQVRVTDLWDNFVDTATTTIPIGVGHVLRPSLSGTLTVNAVNGVATFNDLKIDRPVSGWVLTAEVPGFAGAGTSDPITTTIGFDTIAVGSHLFGSTCGISVRKLAFCWGSPPIATTPTNGIPNVIPVPVPGGHTFTTITVGARHACALTPAGAAYCWGSNLSGQLGDGTNTDRAEPVAVAGGITFQSISAGAFHTCGVAAGTNGGPAYCWGYNWQGQLGDGTMTERNVPTPVSGGLTFIRIDGDSAHSCGIIIRNGQEGVCWGDNSHGQLGDSTRTQRLVPTDIHGSHGWMSISVGERHSCGITGTQLRCWGSNAHGQLGIGAAPSEEGEIYPVVVPGIAPGYLSVGSRHTCVDGMATGAATGQVYCFGLNAAGQLGDNSTTSRNALTQVAVPNLEKPAAGGHHSCAIDVYKRAYCWGSNGSGQLGDATQDDRLAPVRVAP